MGICGCSLFLAGMETSLQARGGMRVRRLGNSLSEAVLEINMLAPHAVIFEMGDAEQAVINYILGEHPGTMLIGLEAERDYMTVFSVSEQRVSSVEELVRVIREQAKKACPDDFGK